ncbi:hypothetical protein KUL72_11065 [Bradyrhizobium arachidis]|uniref:hypothetical protein n=1 Tax=Bradyrhizobium TaxID=374 RepID=UPI0021629192|nr:MULTISPECIES: hypothetical protein [Bradyrhizobium]MDN4985329.1 hypothetical protein [Bradyrhizobium sp. WYCCWR 13022]UVO38858.1 hypothetical protein KUL72_11065 [Bradyrhizobium arachidis]
MIAAPLLAAGTTCFEGPVSEHERAKLTHPYLREDAFKEQVGGHSRSHNFGLCKNTPGNIEGLLNDTGRSHDLNPRFRKPLGNHDAATSIMEERPESFVTGVAIISLMPILIFLIEEPDK